MVFVREGLESIPLAGNNFRHPRSAAYCGCVYVDCGEKKKKTGRRSSKNRAEEGSRKEKKNGEMKDEKDLRNNKTCEQ